MKDARRPFRRLWGYGPALMLLCGLWAAWDAPGAAQGPVPLEVYAQHDRAGQTLTLSFTDPVSGLSTPTLIGPFPPERHALDDITLLPNGAMLRNPGDGALLLATPDGRLAPHPFIPQTPTELVTVEWVLSPDGQSIAWAEIFPAPDAWISNVYVADARGFEITQLPAPPLSDVEPFLRARPVAVSDDRSRVYLDLAAPVARPAPGEYFTPYRDVYVYEADAGAYQQISGEPGCACAVGINPNTGGILRETRQGEDVALRWLGTQAVGLGEIIAPLGLNARQAGDFLLPTNSTRAFYTQWLGVDADGAPQYALAGVDMVARMQQALLAPSAQRLTPLALLDDGATLVLAGYDADGTYKLDLASGEMTQVSNAIWLGNIER